MITTKNTLIGLAFACVVAGCSGPRLADRPTDLPDAFPFHTAAQIQQYLQLEPDTLYGFSANARVSMRSPANSGSFSARVEHRRSDSLYMSIRVTLGIEAARTLVTPDSFFVYDRIHKQLIYGSLDYTAGLLPEPFASDDLFPSLLGLIVPEAEVPWRVEADSAFYYLHDPANERTYAVDPALWRVVRYEERTPSGMILEERVYSDFDLFHDLYLPRRVVYNRPLDDASASIYYRSLSLNPGEQAFDLRLGDNVERVPVYALD